jgi:hypothetical protein
MPRCTKHKRFDIKPGTFYRCADFTKTQEWEPKNKIKQNQGRSRDEIRNASLGGPSACPGFRTLNRARRCLRMPLIAA